MATMNDFVKAGTLHASLDPTVSAIAGAGAGPAMVARTVTG